MRLKRSSEGGMSISVVDMEIPEDTNKQYKRLSTIKQEEPVPTKKRTQSAKPGPTERYRYTGTLKNHNKTKQDAFMASGRDMIYIQGEVTQSNQDLEMMNARINTLKRKVERAEKKQKKIEREQQNVQKANSNKMEKSQSRVELIQKNQIETEIKRQRIQEEKQRRSASKQKRQEEVLRKQDETRRKASEEKKARLADIEADRQKDYERRMRNYAKIRAYKDEVSEKHKNDEVEYVGRIKHMYHNDRKMKKTQADINKQMLRDLEEEERKYRDQLQQANERTDNANYELSSMKYGMPFKRQEEEQVQSQRYQQQESDIVVFESQKNMSMSNGKSRNPQNKQKRGMTKSQTSSTLKTPKPVNNNYRGFDRASPSQQDFNQQEQNFNSTLQPQQRSTKQQQQQFNSQVRLNKPIVKEQAQTAPSQVLKEEMILTKNEKKDQLVDAYGPAPAQGKQQQDLRPPSNQAIDIKLQQSSTSFQSQQTPNAPPMKASLIKEEIREQEMIIQDQQQQQTPVKRDQKLQQNVAYETPIVDQKQEQAKAQVQSAIKQADQRAEKKQVQIAEQSQVVRQKLDLNNSKSNIQQQKINISQSSTVLNSQQTKSTIVQQKEQSVNIVTTTNIGKQTIKQEVKQAVVSSSTSSTINNNSINNAQKQSKQMR